MIRARRFRFPIAACVSVSFALSGCSRVTGLPAVPETVTRADAGLDWIERAGGSVDRVRLARDRIERGDAPSGLRELAALVEAAPADIVLGNAFRMEVYGLKRRFLTAARARGERSPAFPDFLSKEPLATLTRAASTSPAKELRIQIALAHVDRMMLDPALEVRAPASIDSVHAFTSVLAEHPYDVPALVGRGLNHLNRPRKLVWPEHPAPPADAASHDLALAAAVGAAVGGASPRVKGLLLLLLGDAYAHEGKAGIARSFWTLAGEATDDRGVHAELAVRAGWPEPEMPDRVEARLAERMAEVDAPVSDLSFLWDDGARGPW
jgi:hypothetical protein